MAVATLPDVVSRLGRPATPDEAAQLEARLQDAEAAIARQVPDFTAKVVGDLVFRANLIAVTCDVALRACGLSNQVAQVVPGDGSFSVTPDWRVGQVVLTKADWARLGVRSMWTADTVPPLPYGPGDVSGVRLW